MNTFRIQAEREGEWRDVTSVRFDPALTRSKSSDNQCRRDALVEARRHLGAWSLYHLFDGLPLRILEETLEGAKVAA